MIQSIRRLAAAQTLRFDEIPEARKAILARIAAYVETRYAQGEAIKLVFICTHNSRRSHFGQIAAALAAEYYAIDRVQVFSGGTEATAFHLALAESQKIRQHEPLGNVESNAIQSFVASFQSIGADGKEWTVRDIAEWGGIGGAGPRIVGSPGEVADQLQEWVDETDVDGFNLAYAITPGTFEDVVRFVVPELQRRGVYRTQYTPGTLRHKLFGKGHRLPEEHRAQQIVREVREAARIS